MYYKEPPTERVKPLACVLDKITLGFRLKQSVFEYVELGSHDYYKFDNKCCLYVE